MTKTAKTAEFESIFDHRIDTSSRTDQDSGWTVYEATKSPQTMAKFIDRARKAGFRSATMARRTVVVRTEELA